MEKIRIDRKSFASSPFLVISDKLQNKKDRYYFDAINKLKKDEFWYSDIDLNIEHGKIEIPIKPVLRLGTPFYHKNKKVGILIINIFMQNFLTTLLDTPLYNIYLIDKDGAIIIHTQGSANWEKYLKKKKSLKDFFPKEVDNILTHDELQTKTFYSKKIFLNNSQKSHLILEPKIEKLETENKKLLYIFIYIMIGVILLSLPIAYIISKTPARLKEEVDILNKDLERSIDKKTIELQELNNNLEDKVNQRTEEQNILLSLFDLSDAVLFKWNNDKIWSVASVTQSVNKLLGYDDTELLSHKIIYSSLIHPDDIKHVNEELNKAIEKKLYFFTHDPYRIITKDGQTKWILDSTVIVRDHDSNITSFVGYLTDISQLKLNEIKLKRLSQTDQLTQIDNRLQLDNLLQDQYYRFSRNHEKCSIILIDIDYFKSVNDDFGHIAGDMILVEFAKLIQSQIRQSDSLGRWGGEEFLIILPHTDLERAVVLAEKLRKAIEKFNFSIVEHKTASFGVAIFEKTMSVEELIDKADKALYKSKEEGRNRVTSA
jgi:diguanylate cyclase (GGDEF)-like protein/PAS domain S-box-containing protein